MNCAHFIVFHFWTDHLIILSPDSFIITVNIITIIIIIISGMQTDNVLRAIAVWLPHVSLFGFIDILYISVFTLSLGTKYRLHLPYPGPQIQYKLYSTPLTEILMVSRQMHFIGNMLTFKSKTIQLVQPAQSLVIIIIIIIIIIIMCFSDIVTAFILADR